MSTTQSGARSEDRHPQGITTDYREIPVENPATGEVIRTVAVTTPAAVPALVERARAAQPGWQALGFEGRGRVLRRVRDWLVDHSDDVADSIVAETGKTTDDALLTEVNYALLALPFLARQAHRWLADVRVRSPYPLVSG